MGGMAAATTTALAALAPTAAEASTTNPFIVVDQGGSGDYTNLETAIREAPAESLIFVKSGWYVVSDTLRPKTGTRVMGEGWGTVVRAAAGLNKNVFMVESDFVTIESLRIEGNKANQQTAAQGVMISGVKGVRVIRCFLQEVSGYAVVAWPGCSAIVVAENWIARTGEEAIEIYGSSHCSVVGNTLVDNLNGIHIWNGEGDSADNTVVGNTVRNSTRFGIVLQDGAHDNTVMGNTIHGSGLSGVLVSNGGNGVTNPANANSLTGNVVTDSGESGMRINGISDTVLTGNTLRRNAHHGVFATYVDSCSITANTAMTNGRSGIRVEAICRNVLVQGNLCRNNGQSATGDGISLYGPITNAQVVNNSCYDGQSTKTQRNGVSLENDPAASQNDNLLVGPNLVEGNASSGLAIRSSSARAFTLPYRRLSATVGKTEVAVKHDLPYAPQSLTLTMRSAGSVWQSRASDATNVYLTADAPSRQVDVLVG